MPGEGKRVGLLPAGRGRGPSTLAAAPRGDRIHARQVYSLLEVVNKPFIKPRAPERLFTKMKTQLLRLLSESNALIYHIT